MEKKEDKEKQLYHNLLNGDIAAMKEFYGIYSGYLTTVCSRYISNSDDVKDVLQESFIKIFKGIENFDYRGLGSLKAWSVRITVNESLRFLKEKSKHDCMIMSSQDMPDIIEDDEPNFDDISTSDILQMIRNLPSGYRTVFNLYVFEQKSHREISSILNITESTSASQLYRAKALLAREINNYKLKLMEQ